MPWVTILLVLAAFCFVLSSLVPHIAAEPATLKVYNPYLVPLGLVFLSVALLLWHAGVG